MATMYFIGNGLPKPSPATAPPTAINYFPSQIAAMLGGESPDLIAGIEILRKRCGTHPFLYFTWRVVIDANGCTTTRLWNLESRDNAVVTRICVSMFKLTRELARRRGERITWERHSSAINSHTDQGSEFLKSLLMPRLTKHVPVLHAEGFTSRGPDGEHIYTSTLAVGPFADDALSTLVDLLVDNRVEVRAYLERSAEYERHQSPAATQ